MSIDLPTLLDYWLNRIERDLAPFVDPNTTVDLKQSGRWVTATWRQRQDDREATFAISPDSVDVQVSGRTMSYRAFFAGPDMADLLGLAKMTLQARPTRVFVQTKAKRVGDEGSAGPALDVLRGALDDPWGSDATLVLMVTGEAGAGKTSVLEEMVRTQADGYVRGRSQSLFLYVNAQGRALARFQEALATELQDLRATLTYHAVSTLVRLGLLIPVIDGFDELLGVGGYDDAFSSLASFIEELNGSGRLIASARSTYYEQEFVSRANRVSSLGSQVWKQIPIEVLSWDTDERHEYLNAFSQSSALPVEGARALTQAVDRVFDGPNTTLGTKPFFVARATKLIADGVDLRPEGDLLSQMVSAHLERERGKLKDRTGGDLLTADQIRTLLVDLAEEMWNQETRELDSRTVREIAEYSLVTRGVDDSTQRIVVEKMPSLAFLRSGERPGSIAFEHETFFAHFLAQRFASMMLDVQGIPSTMLGRSVLPDEVAESAVRAIAKTVTRPDTKGLLHQLSVASTVQGSRASQVRENAGVLVATLLRQLCAGEPPCVGLAIRGVIIPGQDLRNVRLEGATIEEVEFRRVDLTNTHIRRSMAKNVMLLEVLVDQASTRLELSGLDASQVVGLRDAATNSGRPLFAPGDVARVLIAIGALASDAPVTGRPQRQIAEDTMKVLERFVRAYNRSNPVCTSDDFLRNVFHHPNWDELQALLVASGVVTEEYRATGGQPKMFLRRQVLAEEIIAGVNPAASVPESVRLFWDKVEERFPA